MIVVVIHEIITKELLKSKTYDFSHYLCSKNIGERLISLLNYAVKITNTFVINTSFTMNTFNLSNIHKHATRQ